MGECRRKKDRSWAGVVVPPTTSWGRMKGAVAVGRFSISSARWGSSSAEGAWKAMRSRRTLWIWVASSRVGDTTMAAMWCFLVGSSLRRILETTGSRKLRVFPEPVTASTTTSLFVMKTGRTAACTGVMRANRLDCRYERIHSASGGVRASHARASFLVGLTGGIVWIGGEVQLRGQRS